MFRFLFLFLLPLSLFSAQVNYFRWSSGDTYLTFLEKLHLPTKPLYYNLDADDQKLTEEIRSGVNCQLLQDSKKQVQQILIPINDQLQIHITNTKKGNVSFEVIPIISETKKESVTITIESAPYNDIIKQTNSSKLAKLFMDAFKNSLNFKNVHKGDKIVMVYDRMYRMGQPFSMPVLNSCMIEMSGKQHYVFRYKDDRYYDETGAEVEVFLLASPVRGSRISSGFTLKRWHPILHKFRAHLGVDYAARPGTPILAAGNGIVSFCGTSNGYGNLTKIDHSGGYTTLYAHQRAFKAGIHKGVRVKQGQVIGFIGTSGLSTGPHLHFGLYKYGEAVDPQRVVRLAASRLGGKDKKAFDSIASQFKSLVMKELKAATKPVATVKLTPICYADALGKEKQSTKNSAASQDDDN
jgi:murein DD-endopeptidase MepM/ murein hydrolase activator NlpD